MNLATLTSRLKADPQTFTGSFVLPAFGLELQPGFVAAARLNSAMKQIQSLGVRDLPEGALVASPNKSNLSNKDAVRQAISEVCERVGNAGGKIGLLLPDVSARVALLQFETLPENRRDADTLIRWKMREYLPYAPEDARLSYQVLGRQSNQIDLLAVAVRNSVLAEFEGLLEIVVRGGPALVLPSSVALLPLLPENTGGQLLLHLCPGSLTAVVVAANTIRYWRTRQLSGDAAAIAEEVSREATRVLATCQDNLGVQVENVWYCARPPASEELEQVIARSLGRTLSTLRVTGLPSGQSEALQNYAMPFAGLMANLN